MKKVNRDLISRTGNRRFRTVRRCGYGLKFPETNPNLSNLVLYYKKMKDMDTMKPLTNTQISKLLSREYNLSVSDESVGKILEDIEGDTWNLHSLCIIKFVRNTNNTLPIQKPTKITTLS